MNLIEKLTELVGFHGSYIDHFGNEVFPNEEAKRTLLEAMGYHLDDVSLQESINCLKDKKWIQPLDSIYFISSINKQNNIFISLPTNNVNNFSLRILLEDETSHSIETSMESLYIEEYKTVHGNGYNRCKLVIPPLKEGYHKLKLSFNDEHYQSDIISSSKQCYSVKDAGAKKVWGYAVQLYSLKSDKNWGLGDFSDLGKITKLAANTGASVIGINPLHALYYNNPAHISPYSPSSRRYLNTLYIDVTRIENFEFCEKVQKRMNDESFIEQINHLRQQNLVDYPHSASLKKEILSFLFEDFYKNRNKKYKTSFLEFENFRAHQGNNLTLYATYEALYEYFTVNFPDTYSWKEWSFEYQSPDSSAVKLYQKDNNDKILFYSYLQWIAHKQLSAVNDLTKKSTMPIGLYLDLAVGCDGGGFDVWSQQALHVKGAAVGAPPDAMNNLGQDWGLTPINPLTLREQGYSVLISTLRSSMQYAGALRIDHILGLMRQYWVAPGMKASEGIFISFPFDEILSIIALESQRNKCIVIGEDLGTIPAGFSEHIQSYGLLSYKILFFERWWETGLFKRPERYSDQAMVTASTHDLPTIKGWWMGRDLEWRQKLELYPNDDLGNQDRSNRISDRERLLAALIDFNVITKNELPSFSPPETNRALILAVHNYLASTPSPIHLIPLEDVLEIIEQVNIPGTVDEHPNWRQKLPLNIDDIFDYSGIKEVSKRMRKCRPTK